MMPTATAALAMCLLASLVLSSPSSQPIILPPSKDPWYTAPPNFEVAQPGEILRLRTAPGTNLTSNFNASSAAYNILYRTTDSNYQPSWAVTSLFIPTAPANTSALLSYQIPYNTADIDSSPSYSLDAPPGPFGSNLGDLVYSDIQTALQQGWYVNVPDFEGPLASFLLGVQEGHATLDSMRAALSSGFGLLAEETRVALWGYSGGSIASEWAAELQAQYAPELRIDGVALGGLVDNGTAVFANTGPSWWSGLIPVGLLGVTSQNPDAREQLLAQLKVDGPYNKTAFLEAGNVEIAQAFELYANQSVLNNYFIDGPAVLNAPVLREIMDNNLIMGFHGIPQAPLFVYKAVQDEIAPTADTNALVSRYCDVGVNIRYERNTIGGHLAEETNGDARAIAWLQQVLSGTYNQDGCTVTDVSLNVTDSLD